MYRPAFRRIRIKLGKPFKIAAAAVMTALVLFLVFFRIGPDDAVVLESYAVNRFQESFDDISADVLSDYAAEEANTSLPTSNQLAMYKPEILKALRKELDGPQVVFLPLTKNKLNFIRIPKLLNYSTSISGNYRFDFTESGINMGVLTIRFIAKGEMKISNTDSCVSTEAECIVYQQLLQGEIPDICYGDLFE